MKKRFGSKILTGMFAFVMGAAILLPSVTSYAFNPATTEVLRVTGDGVRLRSKPIDGTVLELMYKDDKVLNDYEYDHATWANVKRVKTGTVGYMSREYYKV